MDWFLDVRARVQWEGSSPYAFFHAQMSFLFGTEVYRAPSLPFTVHPRHSCAGYAGEGRSRYFFCVWRAMPRVAAVK